MGTAIAKSTIHSQAYSNIFELVDDRSKVVDPKRKSMTNASSQKRKFVYDSDPFEQGINFDDLPYIILELPEVSDEEDSHSLDGTKQDIFWTQKVTVRTKRESSSKVDADRGRTDMLDICDDLFQTFNDTSNKDTFRGYNMHDLRIVKTDSGSYALNNSQEIYESILEISYNTRLAVSS